MEDAEIGMSPGTGARLRNLSKQNIVVLCCPLINEVWSQHGGEGVLWGQATHVTGVEFYLNYFLIH